MSHKSIQILKIHKTLTHYRIGVQFALHVSDFFLQKNKIVRIFFDFLLQKFLSFAKSCGANRPPIQLIKFICVFEIWNYLWVFLNDFFSYFHKKSGSLTSLMVVQLIQQFVKPWRNFGMWTDWWDILYFTELILHKRLYQLVMSDV